MRALALVIALPLLAAGCPSIQRASTINEMTEPEFTRYAARLAAQVELVAVAAVSEGDISPEALASVASAIRGVAAGTTAGGGLALAEILDLDGYGALALSLAVVELDARLEASGAYSADGVLGSRGILALEAVADALDQAATTEVAQ